MPDFIKDIWRKFGFWHWILPPLIALEATIAICYWAEQSLAPASRLTEKLWYASNAGMVVVLAVLGVAIFLRFKGYSFNDRFDEKVYHRANHVWLVSAGILIFGILLLIPGAMGFSFGTLVGLLSITPGAALIFFAIGMQFVNGIAYRFLWMRSFGWPVNSDEALMQMTDLKYALKVHGPFGIAIGVGFAVVIAAAGYFSS